MKKLNLNTIVTKFKEHINQFNDKQGFSKAIYFFIFIMGLTAFLIQFQQQPTKSISHKDELSIDTYIPNDQGLVTIQVSNYESLDQIIGNYGVVDLYSVPLAPGQRARLIISQVKIVRTPKSPRHFNVLLPASEVGILAGHIGEFTVSVRNPKLFGTKIVKDKSKPAKRRIFFEWESK